MRVENLRLENIDGNPRAVATVTWEDTPRPAQVLFFETTPEFADSLSCSPHAFLVACALPAFYFNEKRVFIDGKICPELKEGLITVMHLMRHWWYTSEKGIVKIEAESEGAPAFSPTPERSGVFFSGGIDAIASLRVNRLNYPLEHPGSFKDALLICGLEVPEPSIFRCVLNQLSCLSKAAGLELIPISTNLRWLGPEDENLFWGEFWIREYLGAALCAIAHAFTNRLTSVAISSGHDVPTINPNASHPLVEPNLSSHELKVLYTLIDLSRFERVRLAADWTPVLKHVRVCNNARSYQPGRLNCGRCEKCVRTMIALSAIGKLEEATAFPIRELQPEHVQSFVHIHWNTLPYYLDLLAPLKEAGRLDLLRIIEHKIAECHKLERSLQRRKRFIEPIIEYDQRHFAGNLMKVKRMLVPGLIRPHPTK